MEWGSFERVKQDTGRKPLGLESCLPASKLLERKLLERDQATSNRDLD